MATIRQAAIENDKATEGKTCEKTQYLTGFSYPRNTPDAGQTGDILYGDDASFANRKAGFSLFHTK